MSPIVVGSSASVWGSERPIAARSEAVQGAFLRCDTVALRDERGKLGEARVSGSDFVRPVRRLDEHASSLDSIRQIRQIRERGTVALMDVFDQEDDRVTQFAAFRG